MKRDYLFFLDDILNSIKKIKKYLKDMDFKKFCSNELVFDAVNRNLEIIGEASSKIPENIQKKYSKIDWRNIKNFRNILAHTYWKLDKDLEWDILDDKLLDLEEEVKKIIKTEKNKK